MPSVTMSVTDDVYAALRERSSAEQIGMGRAAVALVEAALAGAATPAVVPVPAEPTLDEAARVFLRHIRPEQAQLIVDLAAETGLGAAAYILNYIKLADERGETAVTGPTEPDDAPHALPTPLDATGGVCEECGAAFTPIRRGQRFCPDPNDGTPSCGRRWSLREQIHPRRPRTLPEIARAAAPPTIQPGERAAQAAEQDLRRQVAELSRQIQALTARAEIGAG